MYCTYISVTTSIRLLSVKIVVLCLINLIWSVLLKNYWLLSQQASANPWQKVVHLTPATLHLQRFVVHFPEHLQIVVKIDGKNFKYLGGSKNQICSVHPYSNVFFCNLLVPGLNLQVKYMLYWPRMPLWEYVLFLHC